VVGLGHKLGELASRFYAAPSEQMTIAGVTGTNGKTSIAHFLAQSWQRVYGSAGMVGTLGYGPVSSLQSGLRTTPDALHLQQVLAGCVKSGIERLAMEVSSHALHQGRVSGVPFHTAVFTNLSRDHQDYHGDMQAYADAKARLFRGAGLSLAVINVDDPVGADLAAEVRPRTFTLAVGSGSNVTRLGDRYLQIVEVVARADGLRVQFDSSWGGGELQSCLLGRFNAENLALALAVLLAWDMPVGAAVAALEKVRPVAGRMMTFLAPGRPRVVVDYAHTPDALEKVLSSLREHVSGRLICVFGCGGERDRGKRPQMGEVAQRLADQVIVTDDNPRSEDPRQIVAEILSGMADRQGVHVEQDRAKAIQVSIAAAAPSDLILLAGKGHEDYQEIAGRREPFSDIEQVRKLLQGEPA